MTTMVTITVSTAQALDVRIALNGAAIYWGEQAKKHRDAGEHDDAATCEAIRADHNALWAIVYAAMNAPPSTPAFDRAAFRAALKFEHELGQRNDDLIRERAERTAEKRVEW